MKKAQKNVTKEQRYKESMLKQGFRRTTVWADPADHQLIQWLASASRRGLLKK